MIDFLLDHQDHGHEPPEPLPFDSERFEPARLALSNQSGTLVCADYRNVMVLAAYEPVAELNLGIVATIDLTEIRAPFVKTGFIVSGVSIMCILIGSLLFLRLINPLIARLLESEERLQAIIDNSPTVLYSKDAEGRYLLINSQYEKLFHIAKERIIGLTDYDIFPENIADRFRGNDLMP